MKLVDVQNDTHIFFKMGKIKVKMVTPIYLVLDVISVVRRILCS